MLVELLGGWPAPSGRASGTLREWHSLPAGLQMASRTAQEAGCCVEHLWIDNTRCTPRIEIERLPAILTLPEGRGPHPVVIYCHAHGARYDIGKQELLTGRPAMPCGAYATVLAHHGIAALCIDLPCFGERAGDKENTLSKRLLWHGNTLFGAMLRELATSIDYLEQRSDMDTQRLGAMGLSMGSTLAWWIAALDERIRLVAELCCLADLHLLTKSDAHDLHGLYMMVPGLLKHAQTSDINALIAPRPHFTAVGQLDPLTPVAAFNRVDQTMKKIYAEYGRPENWQTLVSPDSAHEETQAMRAALLAFLQARL